MDRNDKVESQQGNRNPYVDYPDLVWDAWFQEGAIGCPTDVNNDGFTNVEDVLSVLSEFGCSNSCSFDVDADGIVGVSDILEILSEFGNAC